MTFVTNKRTIGGILLVLVAIFVYLGYVEGNAGKNNNISSAMDKQAAMEGDSAIQPAEQTLEIKVGETTEQGLNEKLDELTEEEFFVEYRLERDRTRSRQIELLQGIVNNQNSAQAERQEAQKKILAITIILEQELKLENLIKAKGYQDAVLFIQPASVIVIVQANNFGGTDATKISDLVSRTTGHTMEQITIIPKV